MYKNQSMIGTDLMIYHGSRHSKKVRFSFWLISKCSPSESWACERCYVELSWVEYVRDAGCIAALELSTKADKQPSDAPSCDKVMLCGNLRSGISTRTVPWCRSHCDAVTPVILSCSVNSPHWPALAWWELPVYLHTQCPSCWPRLPIQHPSIGKKFQTR